MFNVIKGYFERKTSGAAGYDMLVNGQWTLEPGEVTKVSTNTYVQLPPNTVGFISHRGSVPSKLGLTVELGTFDADYTGELFLNVKNHNEEVVVLEHGSRIAQCVIVPIWINPIPATGDRGESGSSV